MKWTYRLVKEWDEMISLCEVYYEDEKPVGYIEATFEQFEDSRQVENALHLAQIALTKPVMKVVDGVLKEGV